LTCINNRVYLEAIITKS